MKLAGGRLNVYVTAMQNKDLIEKLNMREIHATGS